MRPLTLPLILGVLAGTGVGSFIGANTGLIYGLATGYFILAIGVGWFLLNCKRRSVQTEGAPRRNNRSKSSGPLFKPGAWGSVFLVETGEGRVFTI